jgi:hypothetical protein
MAPAQSSQTTMTEWKHIATTCAPPESKSLSGDNALANDFFWIGERTRMTKAAPRNDCSNDTALTKSTLNLAPTSSVPQGNDCDFDWDLDCWTKSTLNVAPTSSSLLGNDCDFDCDFVCWTRMASAGVEGSGTWHEVRGLPLSPQRCAFFLQ